jgi:hypothetical protein
MARRAAWVGMWPSAGLKGVSRLPDPQPLLPVRGNWDQPLTEPIPPSPPTVPLSLSPCMGCSKTGRLPGGGVGRGVVGCWRSQVYRPGRMSPHEEDMSAFVQPPGQSP